MTKAEFLANYGDVDCKFESYYKYRFSYAGTAPDGATVMLRVGGCADDIYKHECSPDAVETANGDGYSYVKVRMGPPVGGETLYEESRW